MKKAYPFQSSSLELRTFEPEDISALFAYLKHVDLIGRRYLPWEFSDYSPLSRRQVEAIYKKWSEGEKQLNLAILLRESQQLVGHVHCAWGWDVICPDFYIVIEPGHQRKGYGSQVLDLVTGYFFEYTPAHNVTSGMADWNKAAHQFALRNGFKECGRIRRVGLRQGRYFDWIEVDILRSEWLSRTGGRHGS